ncbi:hypothetical protein [Pandoravirus japonicus]|uniref:Uncharacterized protein n=1 Tax=Pandoravirus japonicus TaxID=2823154 RepID=A0A811BP26_9VIRU|nr:hypothetical protein [Pandoravirus japonicus]
MATEAASVFEVLDNDVLFYLLTRCLDARWHAFAARVCRRWRALVGAAGTGSAEAFLQRSATDLAVPWGAADAAIECIGDDDAILRERNMERRRALVGWAARVRVAVRRRGPTVVHRGHLLCALGDGHTGLAAWIRGQRANAAPCPCATGRTQRPTRPFPTIDDDYSFCSRCASDDRLLDGLVWRRLAATPERIRDDIRSWPVHDPRASEPTAEHQREAFQHCIVPVVHAADAELVHWLLARGVLCADRALWVAIAAGARLDIAAWLSCQLAPDGDSRCVLDDHMARDVAAVAARHGALNILQWMSATADVARAVCAPNVYRAALRGGHIGVLNWLASHWDAVLRAWDIEMPPEEDGDVDPIPCPSPWEAVEAPTPCSLQWLAARGVPIPRSLLCADRDLMVTAVREGFGGGRVPGSAETMTHAVDVCGCAPPDTQALSCTITLAGRLDLIDESQRRGWVDKRTRQAIWLMAAMHGHDAIVASMLRSAAHRDEPSPIGAVKCRITLSGGRLVCLRSAGYPWEPEHMLVRHRGKCLTDAASILWALDAGCPPATVFAGSREAMMAVCAYALSESSGCSPGAGDAVVALCDSTESERAVLAARLRVSMLVRSKARPPRRTLTTSECRDLAALCQGSLHVDRIGGLLNAFALPHGA